MAAINPRLVHVTVSAFGLDGPKAGWAASDLTILAAGCAQVLNGDSDRPPVRTTVPQAWLHAGAEAAVGALLALTERERSGLGQHVDVSAQQAVMQAGIPGVLLAPNDNAEARRTAGGILVGDLHLQFVYPAADGFVSITLLFGTMIGPFSKRLMEWVHEEGHCDQAMRRLGLGRLRHPPGDHAGRPRRAGAGEGGDHPADELEDQGRAVRRGAAPAPAARPGGHRRRAGGRRAPARPRLLGHRRRPGVPRSVRALQPRRARPARSATVGRRPVAAVVASPRRADPGGRTHRPRPRRSTGSRWSTSPGCSPDR